MAIYRNIHTSFWEDAKVIDDMTSEDRYFMLYLLTNPHGNQAGCYEISKKQVSHETGFDIETIEKLLVRFEEVLRVIRYSNETKELLILNWHRYNWTSSPKVHARIKKEISAIKNKEFVSYINTVCIPYAYPMDTEPQEEQEEKEEQEQSQEESQEENDTARARIPSHTRGEHGYVKLTDDEYDRLIADLGKAEAARVIAHVDESAATTRNKNKWRDWNLVLRKASREGWGIRGSPNMAKPKKTYDYPEER